MAILKCKMCGGQIEILEQDRIAVCEFCGTKQTIPNIDNEKRVTLHNRANSFRLKNEFDKAMFTYENIIEEFPDDAEAHWGLLLCRYGIEYVDDEKTGKRIPTCHRTQIKSIFEDIDYLDAIKYSDMVSKELYEEEAKKIDDIQKSILSISQKETPYDIFICYKETDKNGDRTLDSVIAQDIYDELVKKGYKVFFSRITLESKLGNAYEPIIYAALVSSKVMLVIGTKQEYFNAVWVKNEWSRFISFIENSEVQKYLIPCYKEMDAYDIPSELNEFQCQDLNKLGYMQDLLRGIDKLFNRISFDNNSENPNFENTIRRIEILLADSNYNKANELIEKKLDESPENGYLYYLAMIIELKLKREDDLKLLRTSLVENYNYQKALEYGNDELKEKLITIEKEIQINIEEDKKEIIYKKAKEYIKINNFNDAYKLLVKIKGYKDVNDILPDVSKKSEEILEKRYQIILNLIKEYKFSQALNGLNNMPDYKDCEKLIEEVKVNKDKEVKYQKSISLMKYENIKNLEIAIKVLTTISGYRNSDALKEKCIEKLEKIRKEKAKRKKLIKISISVAVPLIIIFIGYIIINNKVIIPNNKLEEARELINEGSYTEATDIINSIYGYKDSESLLHIIEAHKLMKSNRYEEALDLIDNELGEINITFNSDGGEIKDYELEDSFNKVNCYVVKEGYTFNWWEVEKYTINIDEISTYKCDVQLIPVWQINNYEIKYDHGIAEEFDLPTVYTYNDNVVIPEVSRIGYEFVGWQENGEIIGKEVIISKGSTGNRYLIPIFEEKIYTITYNVNGAENSLEPEYVKFGDEITLKTPDKLGYLFKGWFVNGVSYNPSIYNYQKDITLDARWELINYKITYKNTYAGINLPLVYNVETIVQIPNIEKNDYDFVGWKDNFGNISKDYTIPKYMTGDLILEPVFIGCEHTITYDPNGGFMLKNTQTVRYNENFEPLVATRKGYVLACWKYENEPIADDVYSYKHDITLVAEWVEEFNVSYNLNGGTCTNLPETFSEKTPITLPVPTKTNGLFIGWYDKNDNKITELELKDYELNAKYIDTVIEEGKTYVLFGKYQQSMITDRETIDGIFKNGVINERGYYEYNNNEYILKNNQYFIVEPLKWDIVETKENNSYVLITKSVIEKISFYDYFDERTINDQNIDIDNYEYSNIRAWLNGYNGSSYDAGDYTNKGFLDLAFNANEIELLKEKAITNVTSDKVYILSEDELKSSNSNYKSEGTRIVYSTQYSSTSGGLFRETWLLRSKYSLYNNEIDLVSTDGKLSFTKTNYKSGIRPVIII